MKPQVLVLKTDGINRDEEMAYAFRIAGSDAKIVHVNELRNKKDKLSKYQIVVVPGGFSYGDDVVSGKILAVEMTSFLAEELSRFIERKNTLMLGVCNGFQVLVRTGLLPFRRIGEMDVTLTNNSSGHFECRWIRMKVEDSRCVFLKNMQGREVTYPVAHGEGRFFAPEDVLKKVENENLVAFRYIDEVGKPTQTYPENPNGAMHAIGGITDTTGRILGLMPHPECFVRPEQHPNWRRIKSLKPDGLLLFQNMVHHVKNA